MIRIAAALIALTIYPLSALAASGQKTYDLLFRTGTLDTMESAQTLLYSRDVMNLLKPDAAQRDTGDIALFLRPENPDEAMLEFRQQEKSRRLGKFPASVGNPMIMLFYEKTIRDMAEAAGGSPFYIRNRVKEALVQPSTVELGEATVNGTTVPTKTIRLYPFANRL